MKSMTLGRAVLLVTHSTATAERYATRMIKLREGAVVSDGENRIVPHLRAI